LPLAFSGRLVWDFRDFAVNTVFCSLATLFAEGDAGGAPATPQGGAQQGSPVLFILQMCMLFAAGWYFLFYLPMKRERARQAALLAGIKKNDRVLTSSGILGVVVGVNKDSHPPEVTLRIDETTNAKLRVTLNSVAQVLGGEPSADTPSK
jgi:preprotein translocase subunit YajC